MESDALQSIPSILVVSYAVLFVSNYIYQVLFSMAFGINAHRYYTIQDYFESSFDFVAAVAALAPVGYLAALLIEWSGVLACRYSAPILLTSAHVLLFVSLHVQELVGTKAGPKAYLRKGASIRWGQALRLLMPAVVYILLEMLVVPALNSSVPEVHHIAHWVIQYCLFVINTALFKARIMKRDTTFRPIFRIRFKKQYADLLPDQSRIRIIGSTSKYFFVFDYRTNTISIIDRDSVDGIDYFLYKDRPPFGD